jgi:phosphoribosyl-ATP pyrophosphohydrolase
MAKTPDKTSSKKTSGKTGPKAPPKKKTAASVLPAAKLSAPKKPAAKKISAKKLAKILPALAEHLAPAEPLQAPMPPPQTIGASPAVLDRLWGVVMARRDADPEISHSARLLSRGTAKVAQKFGEEAVECVIEAARNNRSALVYESADVLYHLIVVWVNAGIRPEEIWAELQRREGISGIAEKASRAKELPVELGLGTTKIP